MVVTSGERVFERLELSFAPERTTVRLVTYRREIDENPPVTLLRLAQPDQVLELDPARSRHLFAVIWWLYHVRSGTSPQSMPPCSIPQHPKAGK